MKNKRITQINEALLALDKEDVYSMMLFVLYKLRDNPDYMALSELGYILDGSDLTKFLGYYGGMTITIPTLKDLRLVTQALTLYQLVNLEEHSFEDAVKALRDDEFTDDELKQTYAKLVELMGNYEFKRIKDHEED